MSNYELRHIGGQDDEQSRLATTPRQQQQIITQVPDVLVVGSKEAKVSFDSNGQPIDRYKIVFFILLLHGVGTLMPWNMFINADDYFRNYKLSPNATDTSHMDISPAELKKFREGFLGYLGVAAQIPNVIFNGLNLLINMGSGNLKLRVNVTLALEGVIFFITIILAILDSSTWPGAFFYATMITVVLLNMASGVYQNCIFATGARFPSNYTNAILIGSNFSGTFTSIVNLISIWLAPKPQKAAMYYFITALFIIIVCMISYNLLPTNPFYRHFDGAAAPKSDQLEIAATAANEIANNDSNDIPDSLRRTVDAMVPRPDQTIATSTNGTTFSEELIRKYRIFKQCWPQCLSVFVTFFVTLALFPAVMADIKGKQNYLSEKYFSPIACFFIFNLCAMLGNLISGWTTWPGRDRTWILVFARFLFVPFFLYCNFKPGSRKWPVLIESDIVYILGNVLFALSSGYLSSLCMMFASSNLRSEDAQIGGMLAAFFLVFGIFAGINSSFILSWIIEL